MATAEEILNCQTRLRKATPRQGDRTEQTEKSVVHNIPSLLDPRRIVCLADMAANNPVWWKVNRLHFFCPELTYKEIAAILHITPGQVKHAIHNVKISDRCSDDLPETE